MSLYYARLSRNKARTEPFITLGSAPLFEPGFRSVVLGQLGESRLVAAIDANIAGEQAHAKALDADTKGPLRDIHRRAGTAILFESSGGQTDTVAHLPELRFALGEPEIDTTSIDNAVFALEDRSYFVRKAGSSGAACVSVLRAGRDARRRLELLPRDLRFGGVPRRLLTSHLKAG